MSPRAACLLREVYHWGWWVYHLHLHVADPANAEAAGQALAEVGDAPADKGAAVVDAGDRYAAVLQVGNLHARAERQAPVGERHGIAVEGLAGSGPPAIEAGPVAVRRDRRRTHRDVAVSHRLLVLGHLLRWEKL